MLESKRGGSAIAGLSGTRHGAAQQPAHLGDRLGGAGVGGVDPAVLLGEGAGEDRQLVAQVVEDEHHVGDHQRHVRQAEWVGVGLAQRLDRADQVVAEEADRAAGEGRQVLDRSRLEAGEVLGDRRVGVGGVAIGAAGLREDAVAPAQHGAGAEAGEGVAADLALLGRLEQEAGRPLGLGGAQLQEGRDRRLAVVDEPGADRHDVALLGELARLLEARLELQLGFSRDGH